MINQQRPVISLTHLKQSLAPIISSIHPMMSTELVHFSHADSTSLAQAAISRIPQYVTGSTTLGSSFLQSPVTSQTHVMHSLAPRTVWMHSKTSSTDPAEEHLSQAVSISPAQAIRSVTPQYVTGLSFLQSPVTSQTHVIHSLAPRTVWMHSRTSSTDPAAEHLSQAASISPTQPMRSVTLQ